MTTVLYRGRYIVKKPVLFFVILLCLAVVFSASADTCYKIGEDYEPGWYRIIIGETILGPEYFPAGTELNLPREAVLEIDEEETHRQELLHLGDNASSSADRYQAAAEFAQKLQEIDLSITPVWMVKPDEEKTVGKDLYAGWYNIYYLGSSEAEAKFYQNGDFADPYMTYHWSYEEGTNITIYRCPLLRGTVIEFVSAGVGDTETLWLQQLPDNTSDKAQSEKKDTVTAEQYLSDLREAWENRAEFLLVDKEDTVEHFQRLTGIEKEILAKYAYADFGDEHLKSLATSYYSGVRNQDIAANSYSEPDMITRSSYWTDGYYTRSEALYRIAKEYGFSVSEKYGDSFQTMLDWGRFMAARYDTAMDIRDQIRNHEWGYEEKDGKIVFPAFALTNNTEYPFVDVRIVICFYDDKGEKISSRTIVSGLSLEPGETADCDAFSYVLPFSSVQFQYSNETQNGDFKQTMDYDVKPAKQVSWGG